MLHIPNAKENGIVHSDRLAEQVQSPSKHDGAVRAKRNAKGLMARQSTAIVFPLSWSSSDVDEK